MSVERSQVPTRVEVWSDIACPWCYVGKRRFEAAVAKSGAKVDIVWRSFELNPQAPAAVTGDYDLRLAEKYGMPRAKAQEMIRHMATVGADNGVDFDFDSIRAGNTFDAHRVIHHAHTQGLGDAMKERLLHAYFAEGALMSDASTLARLADEVGVTGAADVLGSDLHADAVRADEAKAEQYGIRGVPFFVLDGRLGVSGAQEVAVFEGALAKAGAIPLDLHAGQGDIVGEVCGPDGCA